MKVIAIILLAGVMVHAAEIPQAYREGVGKQLERAGANRADLEKALAGAKEDEREAMAFLIANMPEVDLKAVSGAMLLENVAAAVKVRKDAPWSASIPQEIFLNDVLPYSSVNERRDQWRKDFYTRFWPWVKDCKTSSEAVLVMNERLFKEVKVSYHPTKRPKPDQSPYESMECGYASCSGLSILLIDACRAVGVPARFVGTPAWTTGKGDANGNHAGNHSWVEVWDGQWHVLGACEVSPLDQTWFLGNASKADATQCLNRIYASSYRKTGTYFPLVWNELIDWVNAENVTQSYLNRVTVKVRVRDASAERPAHVRVQFGDRLVADYVDHGEGFLLNVSGGQTYGATVGNEERKMVVPEKGGEVVLP